MTWYDPNKRRKALPIRGEIETIRDASNWCKRNPIQNGTNDVERSILQVPRCVAVTPPLKKARVIEQFNII